MGPKSKIRDSERVQYEDDYVVGYGRDRCPVGVRVSKGSDRDGSDHYGYGRDEHCYGHYDRGVSGRDEHGRDGNDHHVDGRFDAGESCRNALNGHVRRANAHAHDARGRKRSCQ